MKKVVSLLFAIVIVFILAPNISAAADQNAIDLSKLSISESELIDMEKELVEYGVDKAVAEQLRGYRLDQSLVHILE